MALRRKHNLVGFLVLLPGEGFCQPLQILAGEECQCLDLLEMRDDHVFVSNIVQVFTEYPQDVFSQDLGDHTLGQSGDVDRIVVAGIPLRYLMRPSVVPS